MLSVLVASVSAQAQLRLGPIGGLNYNRQVFKSNANRYEGVFTSRMGVNAGVLSDLVINRRISLQSELLFTQRDGYYKNDRPVVNEEFRSDLSYVSLPACLTYKIDVNKAYLILGAGPYAAKLIHSSHSFHSNGRNVSNGQLRVGTNYETDQIKPWDFGVKLKAGFELKKGMYMVAFYDIGAYDINPQMVVTRNKTFGVQWAFIFSTTEEDRYNRFENFYEY